MTKIMPNESFLNDFQPFVTEEELDELDKLENDRFNDDERAAFLAKLYASREEREKIADMFELGGLTRPELSDVEPIASIAPRKESSSRLRQQVVWWSAAAAAVLIVGAVMFENSGSVDKPSQQIARRGDPETPSPTVKSSRPAVGSSVDRSFALDEFGFLPNGFPAMKSLGDDWVQSETEDKTRDEDKVMDEIARRLKTTRESKEAGELFEKLSPEAKKSVKGEILRGAIAFVASEFETAEQAFRAALELEPGNFVATYNLATTLYALDRPFEAKTYFDALKLCEEYRNNETLQRQIDDLYSEGEEIDEE
jgi:tetratricopeptide (TPR) repeat protein